MFQKILYFLMYHLSSENIRGTEIKNAMDLSMYLLAEANVTVTGDAFGNLTVSVSLMQQATRY
jgi:hypothetical protein